MCVYFKNCTTTTFQGTLIKVACLFIDAGTTLNSIVSYPSYTPTSFTIIQSLIREFVKQCHDNKIQCFCVFTGRYY